MGRLIAVVVFVAVLVPGVLLAREWALAAGRRAVAAAAVGFARPTEEARRTVARQARHGRSVRRLGLLLGLAGVVVSVVAFAEASVFLWVPAVAVGLLIGVVLAEVSRPRPRWALAQPARRPRRAEQISLWLLWTTRLAVVSEALTALAVVRSDEVSDVMLVVGVGIPVSVWVLGELALLRTLVRPVPADGADVGPDEALRTWTAHLVCAATTVAALLPLGALLLTAGVSQGDRVGDGVDLLPVALVAGGFSALAAGLAVAVFLITWLRPLQLSEPALAG